MSNQVVKDRLRGKMIAVIRIEDTNMADLICNTIIAAGLDALEITFTVNGAPQLIEHLKEKHPDALIGAGTVLTESQAEEAYDKGADFIVSPCIVPEVGKYCTTHNIFCSMGAATPTEVLSSHQMGSDVVKLFPGDCLTTKMLKGIRAPLPQIDIMPTGGVDASNLNDWFDCGAFAVGLGSFLTSEITADNLSVLTQRCQELIKIHSRRK